MPYYIRNPKRDRNFDNHPYGGFYKGCHSNPRPTETVERRPTKKPKKDEPQPKAKHLKAKDRKKISNKAETLQTKKLQVLDMLNESNSK